ncbi:hypothetical protein LUZ60_009240 [Juncus effusus]|nr:hypothetical protein LUZ60_009240 [Juncus effusus]
MCSATGSGGNGRYHIILKGMELRTFDIKTCERKKMEGKNVYVPPKYVPLHGSDPESNPNPLNAAQPISNQWSTGICACFDDPQICCLGTICPCILFAKNAEKLGSDSSPGRSCASHCLLWGLLAGLSCVLTGGVLLVLMPGFTVACCASKHRRALREKYTLPETPCNDYCTHLCCHLCALCQESREILHRSDGSDRSDPTISPPQVQTMH